LALTILFQIILLSACGAQNDAIESMMSAAPLNSGPQKMISAQELHRVLFNQFGNVNFQLSDSRYILPDQQKLAQLENSDFAPQHGDVMSGTRQWDCNDYATAAMVPMRNYAFGTMYVTSADGSRHVRNVYINQNHKVEFWEPPQCQPDNSVMSETKLIVF